MLERRYYDIFRECFKDLTLTEKQLDILLDTDSCTIIKDENGFAAVKDNFIRLICVKPSEQHKGNGSKLLADCERLIMDNGYTEAVLGGSDSQLFMGAVTTKEEYENNDSIFFGRKGYKADWQCVEMKLELKDFSADKYRSCNENLNFGFYDGDMETLYEKVAAVDKDWVQYFNDVPVFCAFYNGEIAGFCIVGFDDICLLSGDNIRVGSTGCVGVVPETRNHGIGLSMVALASEELKKHGCDLNFIHCTHLESWYKKLGSETFLRFWFGKKQLDIGL